jgi:Chorismate mutase
MPNNIFLEMKKPNECLNIDEIRNEIDLLDHEIIELLGTRFEFVKEIAKFKSNKEEVEAKKRYDEVIRIRRQWAADKGLSQDVIEKIYKTLIQYFIEEQMKILSLH